ncbi:DUF6303 family protein [Streptomyces goshikiensis]|uniref:DUF6303 family protein n=1 Tax=Streptomyces TaxID=1883 RepID=UPI000C27100C|nr:DUF6303 family protein [Streptomyces sp. CB02120-2]PJN20884.1 hypothetical protein CG724_03795 [Streptomyces sp. CB02120-2]
MARAHLSHRNGGWRLFVALPVGRNWPTRYFAGPAVPTVQERSQALTELNYALTEGAEWSWTEDREQVDDPASPVILIAVAPVVSILGGAS